jgi:ATP-binding protein involved in chromosome partitioning
MIDLKTKDKIQGVKKIIAVASGKGGVGKSTVSSNLAYSLSSQGFKTAIYDADIYGPSIPTIFDLDSFHPEIMQFGENELIVPAVKDNIQIMSIGFFLNPDQPAIWRGPLASSYLKKFLIDTQWSDVDYLIIDLPPGTGDIALTLCQDIPLDGVIMVTTPQNLALIDVQKSLMMFKNKDFNIPIIGVVENMSWFTPELHKDEKYYLFGKDGGKFLAENFKTELLAQIPLIEDLCQVTDKGNFISFTENSIIKTEFKKVANKISSMIKI